MDEGDASNSKARDVRVLTNRKIEVRNSSEQAHCKQRCSQDVHSHSSAACPQGRGCFLISATRREPCAKLLAQI